MLTTRHIALSILCLLGIASAHADTIPAASKAEKARLHWHEHYKVYGFVRNYITFDSRETVTTVAGLFNYMPVDEDWNMSAVQAAAEGLERKDMNAVPAVRFLGITTRVGLDIDYLVGKTRIGGKIEGDFCAGTTANGGTALVRLRHAYITLSRDSLGTHRHTRISMLIGQNWHPLTEDMPDVISLNSGAPFNPFNRSPQLRFNASFYGVTLTAAALWQMQYMSNGPLGPSTQYINRSYTPEVYAGAAYSTHGVTLKAGVDILSICPRKTGQVVSSDGTPIDVRVNDRLTTVSPFFFAEYCHGMLHLAGKTIFAQSGEHLSLGGGYGVAEQLTDGSRRYTPTRTSATWLSVSYGKKVRGSLLAGYSKALGTKDTLQGPLYFCGNSFPNINSLWRLQPSITWTIGKYFVLGAEYELTSAQYGTYGTTDTHALATQDLHWVRNHRVQLMTMLKF